MSATELHRPRGDRRPRQFGAADHRGHAGRPQDTGRCAAGPGGQAARAGADSHRHGARRLHGAQGSRAVREYLVAGMSAVPGSTGSPARKAPLAKPERLATRYVCCNDGNEAAGLRHTRGNGKPSRKRVRLLQRLPLRLYGPVGRVHVDRRRQVSGGRRAEDVYPLSSPRRPWPRLATRRWSAGSTGMTHSARPATGCIPAGHSLIDSYPAEDCTLRRLLRPSPPGYRRGAPRITRHEVSNAAQSGTGHRGPVSRRRRQSRRNGAAGGLRPGRRRRRGGQPATSRRVTWTSATADRYNRRPPHD